MEKKKESKPNEEMICKLCQKGIGGNEHYCSLIEYNEGKQVGIGYYHVKCFRERFMNFEKLQQDANRILSGARGLLTKQGVEL